MNIWLRRIMFGLGAVFSLMLVVSTIQQARWAAKAKEVVGTVEEVDKRDGGCSQTQGRDECTTHYRATLRYEVAGETYRKTMAAGRSSGRLSSTEYADYRTGERVVLLYDPNNPRRVTQDSFYAVWGLPLIILFGAIVAFCFSAAGARAPSDEDSADEESAEQPEEAVADAEGARHVIPRRREASVGADGVDQDDKDFASRYGTRTMSGGTSSAASEGASPLRKAPPSHKAQRSKPPVVIDEGLPRLPFVGLVLTIVILVVTMRYGVEIFVTDETLSDSAPLIKGVLLLGVLLAATTVAAAAYFALVIIVAILKRIAAFSRK